MSLQSLDTSADQTKQMEATSLRAPGRVMMLSTAIGVGGGAEEQVMLLSLGLRSRGWEVKIVSLLPLFPLSAELEASDISISSLGMKRGIPDPRAMRGLIRELRDFRPDIVHCHMPQANLLARAVRPFRPFPLLISTLHNVTMERINGSSGRFLELAHGWTDRFSDITTVICTPAAQGYVQRGAAQAGKITVCYNGVNTNHFQPDPQARSECRRELDIEGKFAWLAIGRFERAKDYPNLVRAFKAVVEHSGDGAVLLICGRGSLEPAIKALVREAGLEQHVRFLGVRRDIPRVMNAADAFVLSSYLEGLPMVLLQASSVGMPIVATAVGGNAEIVLDGVTGFVVPIHDDHALAGAMNRVQTLPAGDRERMAVNGRQHVRKTFEIERILDHWESLYIEKLKIHRASNPGAK